MPVEVPARQLDRVTFEQWRVTGWAARAVAETGGRYADDSVTVTADDLHG